jgi:hypothetical protein
MFQRLHLDAVSVILAILIMAGLIAAMLITLNPMR